MIFGDLVIFREVGRILNFSSKNIDIRIKHKMILE